MTGEPTQTDSFELVKRCFDAYGADIEKWPDDKRQALGALAMSDEMAPIRKEAGALDDCLGAASAPQMSADLKNRIIAQYQSPAAQATLSGFLLSLFSRGRLVPAGALAGIGALGLAAGVLTANMQAALTPEAEVYAYLEEVTAMTLLYQEETVRWDAD